MGVNLNVSYTPKDAVIDTVAIMLIIFPEPATTALGIAMMARPRGKKKNSRVSNKLLRSYPDYVYRVDNIRGREISWEARITKTGQLPLQQLNKPVLNIKQQRTFRPKSTIIQGEIIHHALREYPKPATILKKSPVEGNIHHTIENSPGYIKSQSTKKQQRQQNTVIHHSIENSPAAHILNPVKIEKPSVILQHHTIINPPLKQRRQLIPPAIASSKRKLV